MDHHIRHCHSPNRSYAKIRQIGTIQFPPKKQPEKLSENTPVTPGNPTAFEIRNTGSTIEIEPTTDEENHLVDLRVTPELVFYTGETIWFEGKDPLGNLFKITMPNFCTLRLCTQLTCKDGQYVLAGTLSPKDSKGEIDLTRKVMVFVKCDMLTVR